VGTIDKLHSISTPITSWRSKELRKGLNSFDLYSSPWAPYPLFTIDARIPKLDVAGSIPVSRSMFSITYRKLKVCLPGLTH
jgi:hypothetical protein